MSTVGDAAQCNAQSLRSGGEQSHSEFMPPDPEARLRDPHELTSLKRRRAQLKEALQQCDGAYCKKSRQKIKESLPPFLVRNPGLDEVSSAILRSPAGAERLAYLRGWLMLFGPFDNAFHVPVIIWLRRHYPKAPPIISVDQLPGMYIPANHPNCSLDGISTFV